MQEQFEFEFLRERTVRHNVFFAARPDETTAAGIARFGAQFARRHHLVGMRLPPERLHVSLLGLGGFDDQLPTAVLETAEHAASAISIAPFQVVFDRVASFAGGRGKRALVLTADEGATGFLQLQHDLKLAMFKAGIKVGGSTAFKPHLTLMYTDRVPEMPVEPVPWIVSGFALIDSLYGLSRHRILRQWPTIH